MSPDENEEDIVNIFTIEERAFCDSLNDYQKKLFRISKRNDVEKEAKAIAEGYAEGMAEGIAREQNRGVCY